MQTKTPCTDYVETKGLIYFARMLDKIRLHAAEANCRRTILSGYEDPTFFDSRCTRFLGVNYDELVERTLQGGSDEEILEWCFARAEDRAKKKFPFGMLFFGNAAGEMKQATSWQQPRNDQVWTIATIFKRGWTCTTLKKAENPWRRWFIRQDAQLLNSI